MVLFERLPGRLSVSRPVPMVMAGFLERQAARRDGAGLDDLALRVRQRTIHLLWLQVHEAGGQVRDEGLELDISGGSRSSRWSARQDARQTVTRISLGINCTEIDSYR